MKTIIAGNGKDFIISSSSRVVKTEDGKNPAYTDKENGIAPHKTFVTDIYFYEDEYAETGRTGRSLRIQLRQDDILKMADEIRLINSTVFEDIVVPDDDLPW